jgi:hypothetical protein
MDSVRENNFTESNNFSLGISYLQQIALNNNNPWAFLRDFKFTEKLSCKLDSSFIWYRAVTMYVSRRTAKKENAVLVRKP